MLDQLGFDGFFAAQMERLEPHLVPGRVVGQHRREWDVTTADGTSRAVLAGRSWAREDVSQLDDAQPAVGDWVALEKGGPGDPPVIAHILDRKTELARSSMARKGARQTLVANVDTVFVVAAFARGHVQESAARRSLHPRRLERYVAAVKKGNAEVVIAINKADLVTDAEEQGSKLQKRLGVPVVVLSCVDTVGLSTLSPWLCRGQTVGLVGLSGVGKSSIVNRLIGKDAQRIGSEREADTRGRHTTTHRELFLTSAGFSLIDTPGMREFALADATPEDLAAFEDIANWAKQCQFRDCKHQAEPGCRVQKAVRDGAVEEDRLDSYLSLLGELGEQKKLPVRRKLVRSDRKNYPKRRDKIDWDGDD